MTLIKTKVEPVLDAMTVCMLARAYTTDFPDGPHRHGSPQSEAHHLVSTEVTFTDQIIRRKNSEVRINLVMDPKKKAPIDVVGLSIWTGVTTVIPMQVTPTVVWLNKAPVAIAHEKGAEALLLAILNEIQKVLQAERDEEDKGLAVLRKRK